MVREWRDVISSGVAWNLVGCAGVGWGEAVGRDRVLEYLCFFYIYLFGVPNHMYLFSVFPKHMF